MTTKDIGDFGEDCAYNYLKEKGYQILERNHLSKKGEVDIIAKDDDTVVFVEVKTRKNSNYGFPCEYVDYKKQQRIINCAKLYTIDSVDLSIRFDVIEVYYTKAENLILDKINHIENAFY